MVCTVVEGAQRAIPLAVRAVYEDSSGHGGLGGKLARKILEDLEEHGKLMQMREVFNGQYLTRPFIQVVNEPITELLKGVKKKDSPEDPVSDFWWPTQWDSGHWLDLVFEKFKSEEFISRLLSRTNLVHRQFGHGKLHRVLKATAADLNLPFQVTVSFAAQHFSRGLC